MRLVSVVRAFTTVIALGVAGGWITASSAAAATCQNWGAQPANVGSSDNDLRGVAATSACNVWAVGYYSDGSVADQTLIEHSNGSAWKVQTSLNPGGSSNDNDLRGVAATSPANAWAVGDYYNGTAKRTLIEHWNGSAWKVQTSPNLGGSSHDNILYGVAATSPTNAWAVGYYSNGTTYQTLIEHWNGSAWKVQTSANRGGSANTNVLQDVAATSSANAWAVGTSQSGTGGRTLVEHWNGSAWKVLTSPSPGGSGYFNVLRSVAATSASNAWAVGDYSNSTGFDRTLIEHWNGSTWNIQTSLSPGGSGHINLLGGVAATSSTNAWAVGYYSNGTGFDRSLVEHWNGSTWNGQSSLNVPFSDFLNGVAATSPTNAWAVGNYYNSSSVFRALSLHCC